MILQNEVNIRGAFFKHISYDFFKFIKLNLEDGFILPATQQCINAVREFFNLSSYQQYHYKNLISIKDI